MTRRIRHQVVFLSFLTSVLLYLDRFVLSYTERLIRVDLGLTEQQMSWGLSAFFWSYALAQVPSGWLTDRFGPRLMLTLYILLWSLGTALMGWVSGFATLLIVRLGIGLAQAGAYPTCASIVSRWVPLKGRGLASSLVAIGGRVGGGIAPLLTAWLVMMYSVSSAPPTTRPSDVLNDTRIAQQILFASLDAPLDNSTEDRQARLDILRPATSRLTPETRDDLKSQVESWLASQNTSPEKTTPEWLASHFGTPPDAATLKQVDPASENAHRNATSETLNTLIIGPLLATADQLKALPVEKEVTSTVEQTNPSDADVLRANRLILEACLPGSLRPYYASGWRPVMWTYGLAGIVVAFLFWRTIRDRPEQHPRISPTELGEINQGRAETVSSTSPTVNRPRLPLKEMALSPGLGLLSGSQFFGNIGWTFLVLQLPRYLQEVHQCTFAERSFYASIPIWCGWGGMFLGGVVTDYCATRFGLKSGRMVPLLVSRVLVTAAFLGMLFSPSLPVAIALLSLVALATDLSAPAMWAFNQDIGGRFVASTLGWANMWGNIGSAVSPLILAAVLPKDGVWSMPFLVCAVSSGLAGLCCLGIDATKSIDPGDRQPAS